MIAQPANQPLKHELVLLADDSAEHACISAFFLRALIAVMPNDDPEVAEGARLCAAMILSRAKELKHNVDHVLARYLAEHCKADSPGR